MGWICTQPIGTCRTFDGLRSRVAPQRCSVSSTGGKGSEKIWNQTEKYTF